jgi:hypothetical protein
LIRSIYHNYLKERSLVGENQKNIFELITNKICLNRAIINEGFNAEEIWKKW